MAKQVMVIVIGYWLRESNLLNGDPCIITKRRRAVDTNTFCVADRSSPLASLCNSS